MNNSIRLNWKAYIAIIVSLVSYEGCSSQKQVKENTSDGESLMHSVWTQDLFQRVIQYDGMRKYYHPNHPGRDTLCVQSDSLPSGIQSNLKGEKDPLFVFGECSTNILDIKMTHNGVDSAQYILDYSLEGVICTLKFSLRETEWVLESSVFILR